MKIIKLNAIDSTSSFLKELAKKSTLDNYTVVSTNTQTKGRGQQTNSWVSEPHKNLTISMFVKNLGLNVNKQKYLNFAVSLAIFDMLSSIKIDFLKIKWPNDIMSGNKKICGILIENSTRNYSIQSSIIGIGLNVNQVTFPESLNNASSLKLLTKKDFNIDCLLNELVYQLKKRITVLLKKEYDNLETEYLNALYKKNCPTMFKDSQANLFIGKIVGISSSGNLQIELENETIKEFGIKEVSLALNSF